MKLTLDWNCVIEVEEQRPQADFVVDLISGHRKKEFEVGLLAASASENTRSKRFPGNAEVFTKRVNDLSWNDLPIVPVPAVAGLTYLFNSYNVGDGEVFERKMNTIWQIMAPNQERSPSEYLKAGQLFDDNFIQSEQLAKWRNTWCDVVSAYSHIHEARDVFVTNNTRDFQDNSEQLGALGMQHICTPSNARTLVERVFRSVD